MTRCVCCEQARSSSRRSVGRLAAVLAALVLVAFVGGCGDDDGDDVARSPRGGSPYLSLSEVQSVVERGELAVVLTGGGDDADLEGAPPLVDSARLESQSGREFDLLVFRTELEATRAAQGVVDLDAGESGVRAANVVAVFPARFSEVDAFRAAAMAMRQLRIACTPGGAGEQRLRRLCFAGEGGVPPKGEGVDRDEAQAEERPVVVDGLRYDPLIARRLNPYVRPDSEILSGRQPSKGKSWFGVFLRVCNDSEQTRTPSGRLALVDAFGVRLGPSDALPASNPFVYSPRPLDPGDCLPAQGSVAERASDGALVLFEVPTDFLRNRPVAVEVAGESGRRERSILDL